MAPADKASLSSGMACNIDSRGRAVRLISGLIVTVIGVVLTGLLLSGILPTWGWILAVAALLGGVFQIYEGWAGWCVVRAMGFKTPV